MIISTNREPSLQEFEELCNKMCELLNAKAKEEPDYYLMKGAQKLEPEVKWAMDEAAKATRFENTIQIVSGQRFPDIVAAKYYGVEVKSTKDDKWTVIGGSVAEGTRVENVEHIFILFGKLHRPVEFKTRRYEDCLCDIAVTHSPRYKIDMNLPEGETIFDKMGVSYNEIRKLDNPIQPVVEYFRSILEPGESLWWVNGEDASSKTVPAKIRMWKSLKKEEREELLAQGFALFPEMFSNSSKKYERFTLWLVTNHGVILSSMRDPFSAGGQRDLEINGKRYEKLPQKYIHLFMYREKVEETILKMKESILEDVWKADLSEFESRMQGWIRLVAGSAVKESFDVSELLIDMFQDLE